MATGGTIPRIARACATATPTSPTSSARAIRFAAASGRRRATADGTAPVIADETAPATGRKAVIAPPVRRAATVLPDKKPRIVADRKLPARKLPDRKRPDRKPATVPPVRRAATVPAGR